MTLATRPAQVAGLAFAGGLLLLLGSSTASAPASFAELIQKATPSVVTVLVERKPENAAQRAVERAAAARDTLYGSPKILPPDDRGIGLGSGFIISADGLIVTNRHVIADGGQLRVRLASGRACSAQIVGSDTRTDIALLKVKLGGP
jgi:serine protease Do